MLSVCPTACPALTGGVCPGPGCPFHGAVVKPRCPASCGHPCPGPSCPAHGFNAAPPICPGNSLGGGSRPVDGSANDRRPPRVFREIKDDRLVLHIGRDDARGKPAKIILTLTSPKVIDQKLCTSSVGVQVGPGLMTTGEVTQATRTRGSTSDTSPVNRAASGRVPKRQKKKRRGFSYNFHHGPFSRPSNFSGINF